MGFTQKHKQCNLIHNQLTLSSRFFSKESKAYRLQHDQRWLINKWIRNFKNQVELEAKWRESSGIKSRACLLLNIVSITRHTCEEKPTCGWKNLCIIQTANKSIQFFFILSATFSDPAGCFSTGTVALGCLLFPSKQCLQQQTLAHTSVGPHAPPAHSEQDAHTGLYKAMWSDSLLDQLTTPFVWESWKTAKKQ